VAKEPKLQSSSLLATCRHAEAAIGRVRKQSGPTPQPNKHPSTSRSIFDDRFVENRGQPKPLGELYRKPGARTIDEAERRARDLRADMVRRGVHADVVACCRPELLADDYFHAVLEAVKSVGDKLRVRTGLQDDGATLVDRALAGDPPMLAINQRCTKSEIDEQRRRWCAGRHTAGRRCRKDGGGHHASPSLPG